MNRIANYIRHITRPDQEEEVVTLGKLSMTLRTAKQCGYLVYMVNPSTKAIKGYTLTDKGMKHVRGTEGPDS